MAVRILLTEYQAELIKRSLTTRAEMCAGFAAAVKSDHLRGAWEAEAAALHEIRDDVLRPAVAAAPAEA